MKIAQIAELLEKVPPQKSGGVGRIVSTLTEELHKRGHNVSLFASADSKTDTKLVPVVPRPLLEDKILTMPESEKALEHYKSISINELVENQDSYDIIHDHIGWRLLLYAPLIHKPIVSTIHGPMNLAYRKKVYTDIVDKASNVHFISISKNQRRLGPKLPYVANIYHGIDLTNLTLGLAPQDYFVYLGRITEEKGLDIAISAIKATGNKLVIAGKPFGNQDQKYFDKKISPFIDNKKIKYIGEVDEKQRQGLLSRAWGLINPIQWEEPFGLVVTEAMASGTPIITFAIGSMPEIVQDGRTGFVVKIKSNEEKNQIIKQTGPKGIIEAVDKLSKMPKNEYKNMRRYCRAHVEKNFTVEKMVSGYEKVYQKVLKDWTNR